ncbi:MAG: hypothetical protein A3K06_03740 [Candidatus Doudnabacteria bacterium RIFCSPHIGHO2_01_52_17]|uniref:Uncharacterized protein n=1 Tax=Candidatus Doudnabacteria bacterium RIFCSPHIGHO2_01_52_17 TaxID=1817820 RepID=A0A1F5NB15_9BACT|nr:MAG: hypothetical protein A3K06_03740 [Candidatus Doudnabacteria bacterium RIFCSPHIGHO2_01_52_17]
MSKRLPKSLRKFLRREKARIRGQFLDSQIREEKIMELLKKFSGRFNFESTKTPPRDKVSLGLKSD